jgi:hypothetical protein
VQDCLGYRLEAGLELRGTSTGTSTSSSTSTTGSTVSLSLLMIDCAGRWFSSSTTGGSTCTRTGSVQLKTMIPTGYWNT